MIILNAVSIFMLLVLATVMFLFARGRRPRRKVDADADEERHDLNGVGTCPECGGKGCLTCHYMGYRIVYWFYGYAKKDDPRYEYKKYDTEGIDFRWLLTELLPDGWDVDPDWVVGTCDCKWRFRRLLPVQNTKTIRMAGRAMLMEVR